ncbi:MAG: UDP-N-acetylmuramoyl-tripeptide--D-alanyl-D-alanine ligase [Caulobacteraceae bacterium]|nr:UDP-N-acetylmuramoyl-tripeptide--D-alanyl-D-alanine ligase [Caulobacter sp.]
MAEPLWTAVAIADATGVSFDTREVQPGDLFVALEGARDGHDFVRDAFLAGAAGALVSRPVTGGPTVTVEGSTLVALEALAAAARERSGARRAVVTGSVGKTSVTQAMLAALLLAGEAHGSVKSFNNHIGVPLTLARMPAETERAVFEIGMNHADEITPLSRLVRPHLAVVTTVGPVHTENFADGEAGVARAKAEIFDGLAPGGVAVIPADGPWAAFLADMARRAGARVLTFGSAEGADAQLLGFEPGEEGASVMARLHGRALRFPLAQRGAHWGPNSLAVLLACVELGVPVETTLEALAAFAPLAGRGAEQRLPVAGGDYLLIDESYNANPISIRAALDTLSRRPGRRIAVLTDMLELGPDGERMHAELAQAAVAADVARVFTAGPLMRALNDALPTERRGTWAATAAELAPAVVEAIRPGDVVMIKGSNGSKASLVVRALQDARRPRDAG